jgi:hypothetical protein
MSTFFPLDLTLMARVPDRADVNVVTVLRFL